MEVIHKETCIRFVPYNGENDTFIEFIKAQGCGSQVGYRPNQDLPLQVAYSNYCLGIPGAIQHELLHVTGLFHEQCRPDRDEHIKVIWENVEPREYHHISDSSIVIVEQSKSFRIPSELH